MQEYLFVVEGQGQSVHEDEVLLQDSGALADDAAEGFTIGSEVEV